MIHLAITKCDGRDDAFLDIITSIEKRHVEGLINETNGDEETPLHLAMKLGRFSKVLMLLDIGAGRYIIITGYHYGCVYV